MCKYGVISIPFPNQKTAGGTAGRSHPDGCVGPGAPAGTWWNINILAFYRLAARPAKMV